MADTITEPETEAPKAFALLYERRMALGYRSLQSFGQATRLSWGHLGKIENGREALSWPICNVLANTLGLDPEKLWAARPQVVHYASKQNKAA